MMKSPFAWNDYYEKQELYNPLEPIGVESVEKSCVWLGSGGGTVLDFGCGSGRMALRILGSGARQIIGLDSSYHGISLARRAGLKAYSSLLTKWLWGSVDSLSQLPDGHLRGLMLASILGYLDDLEIGRLAGHLDKLLEDGARVVIIEDQTEEDYKQQSLRARQQLEKALRGKLNLQTKEVVKDGLKAMEVHFLTYKAC